MYVCMYVGMCVCVCVCACISLNACSVVLVLLGGVVITRQQQIFLVITVDALILIERAGQTCL